MPFANIQKAFEAIRQGQMVILVDDEDRENEGDLCLAAEKVTAEHINFMAKYARGLICLTLTPERLEALKIPMMVADNTSAYGTAFTVSIEARKGVSTGISAADRAHTIRVAVDPKTSAEDLVRPGHIFPLRAKVGGVLTRTGQTEGSVDLARLSGLSPAGVICEIMNDDGSMARADALRLFAEEHRLILLSVAEIISYRLAHESLLYRLTSQAMKHPFLGDVTLHLYGSRLDDRQHVVLVKGDNLQKSVPLVRVQTMQQSSLDKGQALLAGSSEQLQQIYAAFQKAPQAVWVCLDRPMAHERSFLDCLKQETQATASQAVLRDFGLGAQILRDLQLHEIRLLSSQERRLVGLEAYGLKLLGYEWLEPYRTGSSAGF